MSELSQAIEKIDGGGIDWLKEVGTADFLYTGISSEIRGNISAKNIENNKKYLLVMFGTAKRSSENVKCCVIYPMVGQADKTLSQMKAGVLFDFEDSLNRIYADPLIPRYIFTTEYRYAFEVVSVMGQSPSFHFETGNNFSGKVYEVVNK